MNITSKERILNPARYDIPDRVEFVDFMDRIKELSLAGYAPLCLFGSKTKDMFCIMFKPQQIEILTSIYPEEMAYPSLTTMIPSFHMFERELYEEHGIMPIGHPQLKPIRKYSDGYLGIGEYPFVRSDSSALHEVGVGPVHAGVIEPGHFRFTCNGENVESLEIQLGFQHRGILRYFESGDIKNKTHIAECIAGDSVVANALAYCSIVETLSNTVPESSSIRQIALELERIAMHLADLSALAGDIAYIMGQNMFAALRTMVINSTLSICGSRFGKRWLCPGGVNYGISDIQRDALQETLKNVIKQVRYVSEAMLNDTSVLSRFDGTGVIDLSTSIDFGFSGVTAKASGLPVDVRSDFPMFSDEDFLPCIECSGDVYARAKVRCKEIYQSIELVRDLLESNDGNHLYIEPIGKIMQGQIAIACVEAWRGRLVHIATTSSNGEIIDYRVYDPSFNNWHALSLVVQGEGISDFPLCNKSFDLSYCGCDL